MDRTACTEPQYLYSIAIPLLPLWAVRPGQSLSACIRVHFTVYLYAYVERNTFLLLQPLILFALLFDMKQVFLLINFSLPLTVYLPAVTPNNKKVIEVTLLLKTPYFSFLHLSLYFLVFIYAI